MIRFVPDILHDVLLQCVQVQRFEEALFPPNEDARIKESVLSWQVEVS